MIPHLVDAETRYCKQCGLPMYSLRDAKSETCSGAVGVTHIAYAYAKKRLEGWTPVASLDWTPSG